MNIKAQKEFIESKHVLFYFEHNGKKVAEVSLLLIFNPRTGKWHAKIEDLFVQENFRGKGIATKLIQEAIEFAKEYGCYKITLTSRFDRYKLHKWYQRLGFKKVGYSFRMELK